jgi:L-alanine-DL-glutamate epimerase-like enolase superfamily enzyme
MSEALVTAVEIARAVLPMARPVHIGRTTWREREYAVLRVHIASGEHGDAFGYTRSLPVTETLERLAPSIVGSDATRPAAAVAGLAAANPNADGPTIRAIGLVDIAFRDAQARLAGLPLWRMLGGARNRVPVVAVGGYADDPVTELRRLADQGFGQLKLHSADPDIAAKAVRALDGQATLGVDAGMAWESLSEALDGCQPLDGLGLAFIEDPVSPERWQLMAELADQLQTPLAAGEDAAGFGNLVDLLEGATILRIDATASGGVEAVLDAAVVAMSRSRRVMTHAFPDLHAHLAGSPAVEAIEMIPDESGVNPIGRLLGRRQRIEAGELVLSEEPGHGAPLDWGAVTRHANRLVTIGEESSHAA